MKFLKTVFFSYIIYYKILSVFLQRIFRSAKFIFGIIYLKKSIRMMMTILTLQQYYNEISILPQHSIYNVLNGHCKVPATFQKPFWQLYKYSDNIARFQWNIFEILPQYYGSMWGVQIFSDFEFFENFLKIV